MQTGSKCVLGANEERKYFDSGDYALSKAGRAPGQSVGTTIPNPEIVPHAQPGTTSTHPAVHSGLSPPSHVQAEVANAPGITYGHARTPSFNSSPLASSFPTANGLATQGHSAGPH